MPHNLEGVVKFTLHHTTCPLPSDIDTSDLHHWRTILRKARLIGRDADRYDGAGYGNLSKRLAQPNTSPLFLITGTQTGHLETLTLDHYALVTECDLPSNTVQSYGPTHPSSESLTHAAVYTVCPDVHAVFHVHSPPLWKYAKLLNIPSTHPNVPYGTPEMAREVHRLFKETPVKKIGIFAMGGHEDGLVAFGPNCATTGTLLQRYAERVSKL